MLTQSEIDAIKQEAEKTFKIHDQESFKKLFPYSDYEGHVSRQNIAKSIFIATATEERQRAKVLLDEKDKEINDLKDFISQMQHL